MAKANLKRNEAANLAKEFSEEKGSSGSEINQIKSDTDDAWGLVGEKVFNLRIDDPDIDALCTKVTQAKSDMEQAKKQAEMISQALSNYSQSAVDSARKSIILIGSILLLLLLAAFYFAFS
jgi:hypothetical protein